MWPLAQPMKLSRGLLKRSGNDLEINVEIWIFRRSRLLKWSFTPTTGLTRPSMETPMTWHSFRWTRWKLFLAYWVHFTGCLLRPRSCGERCDPRTPNLSPSLWTGGLENDQVLNSIVSLTKGNRSHVWDNQSINMYFRILQGYCWQVIWLITVNNPRTDIGKPVFMTDLQMHWYKLCDDNLENNDTIFGESNYNI